MANRLEKVTLSLEDNFTTGMARAAAATALLDKNLNSLSGSSVQSSRATKDLGTDVDKTSTSFRRGSADINQFSGRLRLITEAVAVLGPGLVPIGAVAVPAVMALAGGLGAAAGALGVTLLAVNGLGDGLKALNAYQLSPTTENLQKMRVEMDSLGPAGASFVRFLDTLEPELRSLQGVARQGMFPGVEDGLTSLLSLMPQVRLIVFNLATEMGRLSSEAGAALSGDGFAAFFDYLETDAAPTLAAFSHSIGNVAMGLGSLLVAFAPLSRDFSAGMESMTASFADWAAGLSQTDGFRDFVAYVRESGPQVLALLGSLATAFIDIAQAAAPVGAVLLPTLTALAKVLSAIASSPIGQPLFTAAAALIVLNRAVSLGQSGFSKYLGGLDATTGGLTRMQKAAGLAGAALAGLAIIDAVQDGADKAAPGINALTNSLIELGDTDTGKLPADLDDLAAGIERIADPNTAQGLQDSISAALGGIGNDSLHDNAVKQIEAIDQALTSIVNNQGAEVAAKSLEGLGRAAGLSESEMADLTGLLPGYEDAVAGVTGGTDGASAAQKRYTKALQASARVNGLTREQVEQLNAAMEEQTQEALSAFDAITSYREALKAAAAQAKRNNAGIADNSKAALNNRAALSQLAGAWNNQGEAVRNNMNKWREARASFIQTAVAMGVPIQKARELANSLLEIPRQRQIDIKLYGSEKAASQIENIRAQLASIPRSISTQYYVNQVNRISKGPVTGPGANYADGGFTGLGGKYEPAGIVHRGEVVLPQEVVRRDWGMLSARYGNLPGFADGGMVGTHSSSRNPDGTAMFALVNAASQSADALFNLAGLGKKELTVRSKLLQKEVDRDKQRADALRSEMDSIRSSVADSLRGDIFNTGGDASSLMASGLSAGAAALHAQGDPVAELRAQTREAREKRRAIAAAARAGVDGQALAQLGQENTASQIRALLADPSFMRQYERAYNTREHEVRATGSSLASAALGKQYAASLAVQHEQAAELRAVNRKLEQIRRENAKNSKDNARDVKDGVNGAATAGAKGRAY